MLKNIVLIVSFFVLFFANPLKAETIVLLNDSALTNTTELEQTPNELNIAEAKKNKLITIIQKTTAENKKLTAAVFALTLGMLGVHRIYLGTAPYIPAVYLFTFGGGFFVLPLIDLVMILSTNDISKFENNNKLLMWAQE